MPEGPWSPQEKLTVTAVLFQPLLFGPGLRLAEIVGGCVSSFTVAEPFAELPSTSVACAVRVVVPLLETLLVDGVRLATPTPASLALQLIETGAVLFQPAAFGAGLTTPLTSGPVLSAVYETLAASGPALLQDVSAWAVAMIVRTPSPSEALRLLKVHVVLPTEPAFVFSCPVWS